MKLSMKIIVATAIVAASVVAATLSASAPAGASDAGQALRIANFSAPSAGKERGERQHAAGDADVESLVSAGGL